MVIIPWVPVHKAPNLYPSPLIPHPCLQDLKTSQPSSLPLLGNYTWPSWYLLLQTLSCLEAFALPIPPPQMPFPLIFTGQHLLAIQTTVYILGLTWPSGSSTTLEPPESSTLILCPAPSGISIFYYWNEFSPSPLVIYFPVTNLLKFICNPQINTPDTFMSTCGQVKSSGNFWVAQHTPFPAEVPQGDLCFHLLAHLINSVLSVV